MSSSLLLSFSCFSPSSPSTPKPCTLHLCLIPYVTSSIRPAAHLCSSFLLLLLTSVCYLCLSPLSAKQCTNSNTPSPYFPAEPRACTYYIVLLISSLLLASLPHLSASPQCRSKRSKSPWKVPSQAAVVVVVTPCPQELVNINVSLSLGNTAFEGLFSHLFCSASLVRLSVLSVRLYESV